MTQAAWETRATPVRFIPRIFQSRHALKLNITCSVRLVRVRISSSHSLLPLLVRSRAPPPLLLRPREMAYDFLPILMGGMPSCSTPCRRPHLRHSRPVSPCPLAHRTLYPHSLALPISPSPSPSPHPHYPHPLPVSFTPSPSPLTVSFTLTLTPLPITLTSPVSPLPLAVSPSPLPFSLSLSLSPSSFVSSPTVSLGLGLSLPHPKSEPPSPSLFLSLSLALPLALPLTLPRSPLLSLSHHQPPHPICEEGFSFLAPSHSADPSPQAFCPRPRPCLRGCASKSGMCYSTSFF